MPVRTEADARRKTLVVSAWDPELAHLRARLGDRDDGERIATAAVGVGLVEAAIGLARALDVHAPDEVVFVGTCGRLFEREEDLPSVPEVVVGREAILLDLALFLGKSELPGPLPAGVVFDARLVEDARAAGARPVTVGNALGITLDEELAARFASRADVEHLEAFSIGRASASRAIPCVPVLGIANSVGPRGREQWLAHHEAASARAAEVVLAMLEASFRASTRGPSLARG